MIPFSNKPLPMSKRYEFTSEEVERLNVELNRQLGPEFLHQRTGPGKFSSSNLRCFLIDRTDRSLCLCNLTTTDKKNLVSCGCLLYVYNIRG